jgi:hypothetical protein
MSSDCEVENSIDSDTENETKIKLVVVTEHPSAKKDLASFKRAPWKIQNFHND